MQKDILNEISSVILVDENLGQALRMIKKYVKERPYLIVSGQIDSIENDYELMKSYMLKSYTDSKRADLYDGLLKKLYKVFCDIQIAEKLRCSGTMSVAYSNSLRFNFITDDIRSNLEAFVQDVVMLSLESEETRKSRQAVIYKNHQAYISSLFDFILVSSQWNDDIACFMENLIMSPTIDVVDAQLLITAVMLSAMNFFDEKKAIILINIYLNSIDEHLRQRAFIGWIFSLPYTKSHLNSNLHKKVSDICDRDDVRRYILELQMQVYYCMNAERDNEEIQRDVFPNLTKVNNFQITKHGIREIEEDPMQDILDPGVSDNAMEELEKSFDKMMNMQKAGSDIYFGGFSQMKVFPFFRNLSNWFCPFYIEHPELQLISLKLMDNKFVQLLFHNGPFCDSDKYSFALAMSSVMDKLPANVREMMGNEETIGPMASDIDRTSPAYIRRMYLQDLYRFYRVYPNRGEFRNPFNYFNTESTEFFFLNEIFDKAKFKKEAKELEQFLMKRKMYDDVSLVYDHFSTYDNVDDLMVKASLAIYYGRYDDALVTYEYVLRMEPDNVKALKGKANSSFYCCDYEEAAKCYGKLLELQPNNRKYALNLSVSQINNDDVEAGVNRLYKLDYEYPKDKNIMRALCWGQMSLCKPKLAEKKYDELLASDTPEAVDYLNAGYCKWFIGKIADAVQLLKTYLSLANSHTSGVDKILIADEMRSDHYLLDKNGIADVERKLMIDIVNE